MFCGYVLFRVLEEIILKYNGINYMRSGIRFKIKWKWRKCKGEKTMEMIVAEADECMVCAWVCLKFPTIKSVLFFKVSVMSQNFFS